MPDTAVRPGLELRLRDVDFAFAGEFRLRVPELVVPPGRTVACIGPSGSGKSTLLQLIAGILPTDRGQILLDDVDWADLGEAQRRLRRITHVGLVFQEFELLAHLSVRENILLPYYVQRGLRLDAAAQARATELARATGIDRYGARRPDALSQGERQRVALCRALVTDPPVVLADEPTGNLDPTTTHAVLELMLQRVRTRGATLIMVTHDHSLLDAFDTVIELRVVDGGATVLHSR